MALVDQAINAAIGLGSAKLKGPGGQFAKVAENFIRRQINAPGAFQPKGRPGSRDPLQAGRARLDPLMSFNWYCDMPLLDGTELSWEFVEEATLPFVEFEQVSNYRAGKMYHYANHYSLGTLQLKLYEDSQGSAARYMEKWRQRIINPVSGLYNHPRDYKQIVQVTILDVAKNTVMFLTYSGCWPMRSDPYAMNSGSSERIVHGVELSVDELNVKFGQFAPGEIPSVINDVGADFPAVLRDLPSKFANKFVDVAFSGAASLASTGLAMLR